MSNRPFEWDLSLAQLAIGVGFCCALTTVMALGIFFVIRFVVG
jgi:hypothetical protein